MVQQIILSQKRGEDENLHPTPQLERASTRGAINFQSVNIVQRRPRQMRASRKSCVYLPYGT